jgi:hypothetical protein
MRRNNMGWKYIMFENKIGDLTILFPVIFPDKMVHSDVAAVLRHCQPGWHSKGVKAVSAGKIEHVEVTGLGGDSETLNLEANPADQHTIENYSYMHGII